LHLLPYLGRCRFFVEIRIGLVLKLECAPRSGSLFERCPGHCDRTLHAVLLWGANDLCTKAAHQDALLLRVAFGHKERDLVAAIDTDESKSHAGVACGGLEYLRSGCDETLLLRTQDHAQRGAVLDAAARVQELQLGEDLRHIGRTQPSEPEHR